MNILKCECSIYPGYQVSSSKDVGDFSCIKNMFSDVDFQFIRWHLLISKCQKCLFTLLLYRNCPLEKVNKLAGIRSRPSSWTMDAVSQSLSWWSDKCSQLFGDGCLEFQTKDREDFTFSQSWRRSLLGREIMTGEGNKQPPLCWLPLWVVELGLVEESCANIGSLYIICQHNSSTP